MNNRTTSDVIVRLCRCLGAVLILILTFFLFFSLYFFTMITGGIYYVNIYGNDQSMLFVSSYIFGNDQSMLFVCLYTNVIIA